MNFEMYQYSQMRFYQCILKYLLLLEISKETLWCNLVSITEAISSAHNKCAIFYLSSNVWDLILNRVLYLKNSLDPIHILFFLTFFLSAVLRLEEP
jgi:hypothetical protein